MKEFMIASILAAFAIGFTVGFYTSDYGCHHSKKSNYGTTIFLLPKQ